MTRDDLLSFLKTHKQEMQETYDIEHIHGVVDEKPREV